MWQNIPHLLPRSDLRCLNIFPITLPLSEAAFQVMVFTTIKSKLKAETVSGLAGMGNHKPRFWVAVLYMWG